MLMSLAPSPNANMTAFPCFLISSETHAFCKGVTQQQVSFTHTVKFQEFSPNQPQ